MTSQQTWLRLRIVLGSLPDPSHNPPCCILACQPIPLPVNLRVLPDSARAFSSTLLCCFLGCSIHGCILISYCELQNIMIGKALSLLDVLATITIDRRRDTHCAPAWKRASTEHQQYLVMHLVLSEWRLVTDTQESSIGRLYMQMRNRHAPCRIMTMSVNRGWMIVGLAACVL